VTKEQVEDRVAKEQVGDLETKEQVADQETKEQVAVLEAKQLRARWVPRLVLGRCTHNATSARVARKNRVATLFFSLHLLVDAISEWA